MNGRWLFIILAVDIIMLSTAVLSVPSCNPLSDKQELQKSVCHETNKRHEMKRKLRAMSGRVFILFILLLMIVDGLHYLAVNNRSCRACMERLMLGGCLPTQPR